MAKQIAGLCFLEGTFDDITFYKMDGQYYARAKSSLSSKRVKTSAEFRKTMAHADLLVRASKIGSQIYKALPPGWRQFWMYRGFTGEAYTLLMENAYDDEEVKKFLWQCYVEYWEQRKVVDPDNPIWQPKPKKVRKRRKYSDESVQRLLKRKGKDGKPKWRDLEEEERKRQHKAMNEACYQRTLEKQRLALIEEDKLRAAQSSIEDWAKAQEGCDFYPGPKGPGNMSVEPRALEQHDEVSAGLQPSLQPSLLRRAKGPGIELRGCKPRRATLRRASYASRAAPVVKMYLTKPPPTLRRGRASPISGIRAGPWPRWERRACLWAVAGNTYLFRLCILSATARA
jgi:hypothetical protein